MTKIDKISNWLSTFATSKGFDGYVIGLSGGIDSAVSASLAVRALGKERVHGILLPCTITGETNRLEDVDLAEKLAKRLGIDIVTVKLDIPTELLFKGIKNITKINSNIVLSNIKARLRMTVLRAYAETRHCLVLGTTNKTEEYLGYYTKAGDGGAGVDIEPIADLFKFEVVQMAKDLGNIPDEIINRIPSAGLYDGQTDENEIGITYNEIDSYLAFREGITKHFGVEKYKDHGENMKFRAKQANLHFENNIIDEIERRIVTNDHKRNNPPTLSGEISRLIEL